MDKNIEIIPMTINDGHMRANAITRLSKARRMSQRVAIIIFVLVYGSMLIMAFLKFFEDANSNETSKEKVKTDIKDLNSILNSLSKDIISIQATSSNSQPIFINVSKTP